MAGIKSLAKDTAVYGLSSIIGRFLNWCLVPLYTVMFPAAEYGVVTYIYSVVALVMIVLIYGMETGFFRFANHDRWKDPMEVYSTSLISLAVSSSAFLIAVCAFIGPISGWLDVPQHEDYILMMSVAVALDAFTALPFSYLRYAKRPMRFAFLKLVNIALNITLNIFFILVCPWLWEQAPGWIAWFYDPDFGIGYIFLTNLITSALNLVLLLPELRGFPYRFNGRLWREMIAYSAPLLVLGVAGIMNQTIDKILFPHLFVDKAEAMTQLGIYGANYKIAIVMVMFIQAFRFAYEPFIFAKSKDKGEDRLQSYRDAMKWFVIFSMVIFLGVMFYLDIIRHFISSSYFSGLKVVPVVMIAEFFFGVFFNLSLWYKLTDRTAWGMWLSLFGLAVTLGLNFLLVPKWGYMGCAWAAFGCYGAMMVASYVAGRVNYPIGYNVPRLAFYFLTAMALWAFSEVIAIEAHPWLTMVIRTPLLALYVLMALRLEHVGLRDLIPGRSRNK
ncbi:MAG: oligosaccharide flippase family protein [Duncaniella sp.]|nr:oligosaccharide flippase family protein [Duncaniella sp.]MDE6571941.1 oligosaccharide flippase family protein [Duncaniella sp.]